MRKDDLERFRSSLKGGLLSGRPGAAIHERRARGQPSCLELRSAAPVKQIRVSQRPRRPGPDADHRQAAAAPRTRRAVRPPGRASGAEGKPGRQPRRPGCGDTGAAGPLSPRDRPPTTEGRRAPLPVPASEPGKPRAEDRRPAGRPRERRRRDPLQAKARPDARAGNARTAQAHRRSKPRPGQARRASRKWK